MSVNVRKAEFVQGSVSVSALPQHQSPEIAFIGRSNAGKSSFINFILSRKKLAHSSSTPGKTRELNIYRAEIKSKAEDQLYLVDLPGFGYAKLSKEQRENLSRLIVEYIASRESLKLICLINDCRRDPDLDEISIRDLAYNQGRHLMVVLTKLDKLTKREAAARIDAVSKAYGLQACDLYLKDEAAGAGSFWEQVFSILT